MAQDLIHVSPQPRGTRSPAQRRNCNFVDQVAKKGRLGQDLGVDERRARLKRNGRELVEPMEPARRMNVAQGDREDQAPHHQAREAGPICPSAVLPPSDHMVALVDRFQKWFEMLSGPRFFRGSHEYQRQGRSLEAAFQCTAEAVTTNRHDAALDRPSQGRDQVRQGRDDGVGTFSR